MFALLKSNPLFLRYWIANWFSELADWLRNTTLMFVVMDLSHGSAVAVSINLFCEFAPVFLLGFLVGVFADRWDKKRTFLSSFVVRALSLGGVILSIRIESLLLINACCVISAVGTLLFRSSQSAFLMQFVRKEDRGQATSMRQMASSVLALIGAGIATFFYKWLGSEATISLAILFYLAVLPMILSIRVEYSARKSTVSGQHLRNMGHDLRSGFTYAWHHRTVRPILLANVMFGINAGVGNVLMIFVLTEFFKLPKETLALTAPVEGVSMLVASVLLAKVRFRYEHMVAYAVMTIGIGTADLVLTHSLYIAVIGLVLIPAGVVAYNNSTSTLLQTNTDFEYQGRLNMITQTAWMAPMVLLMLTSGWLHRLFAIQTIILVTGLLIAACGVFLYFIYQRAQQKDHLQNAANV